MSVSLHITLITLFFLCRSSVEQKTSCRLLPMFDRKLYDHLFIDNDVSPILEEPPLKKLVGSNCTYRNSNGIFLISGDSCHQIPVNSSILITEISIQEIPITVIREKSLASYYSVKSLHIRKNSRLKSIMSNAFFNLTKLENLTITSNIQLGVFEEKCFDGLVNLKHITLLGNNIKKISQISTVLNPIDLPSLTYIDLRENNIPEINKDEFIPLKESLLSVIILSSTKTKFIHPNAFDPLKNLKRLNFCQNQINGTITRAIMQNLRENNIQLMNLSLAANPLYNDYEILFHEVSISSVKTLDISNIYFQDIQAGFFPIMPQIEILDLTNIMINDFPEGVINSTIMPRLTDLRLGKNNLRELTSNIDSHTLERLDLSYINFNNLAWNIDFKICDDAFTKVPNLTWLSFDGTRLVKVSRKTFSKAVNLQYLSLKDTSLIAVEDESFIYNSKLLFLDLSMNNYPIFQPLSKSLFKGLYNLQALDLSYSHISNFPDNRLFDYLTSLQYLNLRMNSIYELDSTVFNAIPCLITIDMRYNTMVTWNSRIFYTNKFLNEAFLDYNHISTLSVNMIKDLSSLKHVSLRGNSITCNCELVDAVLENRNTRYEHQISFSLLPFNSSTDLCADPLNLTIVGYLKEKAFSYECQKNKWAIPLVIVIIFLLFTLPITYFIYHNYRLSIEFFYLTLKERLGLIKFRGRNLSSESLDGSEKDAFVSYSCEDESFVEKMVFILEKEGFDLILYRRDFNVGDIIPDKILEAIENSRKTILVLSESFAKSQWCLWEMYIAQHRSITLIHSDHEPLILIKKSDIDEAHMTATLKHLLKTRVFLQWQESPLKQKMFWHQLKLALVKPKQQANPKEIPT